jgi:hypothetical protein
MKRKPQHKPKGHAIRFATNKKVGITRISFIRGIQRVGDAIYVPDSIRTTMLVRRIVAEWLNCGGLPKVTDHQAENVCKDIKSAVAQAYGDAAWEAEK